MASLDDRLDEAIAAALGGRSPMAPAEVATLLEPALPLLTEPLPAPTQAQAFARMQTALVAERARRQKGFLRGWQRPGLWPGASPLLRGAFVSAAAAVVLLLLLAQHAQLYQPHYPLKRGIEAVRLLFVQDAEARADLYAQLAERRLAEAETALAAGQPVPAAIFDSLAHDWERVTALAAPDDEALRGTAQGQEERVQALQSRLGADVQPAATAALAAIRRFLAPSPPAPAPTPVATAGPTRRPSPSPSLTATPSPVPAGSRAANTATPAPPAATETEAEDTPSLPPAVTRPPDVTSQPTATPAPPSSPEPTRRPSDTEEPSDTPEPTETPEPARTPRPTPTPEATEPPDPTRTPRPTPAPEPTETPEPTRTPRLTRSPEPTHTPESTETPERTETPEHAGTPEPTETPERAASRYSL